MRSKNDVTADQAERQSAVGRVIAGHDSHSEVVACCPHCPAEIGSFNSSSIFNPERAAIRLEPTSKMPSAFPDGISPDRRGELQQQPSISQQSQDEQARISQWAHKYRGVGIFHQNSRWQLTLPGHRRRSRSSSSSVGASPHSDLRRINVSIRARLHTSNSHLE